MEKTWITLLKDVETKEPIYRETHRVYTLPSGVHVYESEYWEASFDQPYIERQPAQANKPKPQTGELISFGYKSVDGLGQHNLVKIKDLKVSIPVYEAELTNGVVIKAHGLQDFAKQLRAAKIN